MSPLDRLTQSRLLRSLVALAAATPILACGGYHRPAVQVASSGPTVSYVYGDDDGLLDATTKAEGFCAQYNAWPTAVGFDRRSDGRHVTFRCDQPRAPRAAASVVVPPLPTVFDYPYRDDRGLLAAVDQARRYCRDYDAHPRSTRVTTHPDGSRTVSFQCERT